MFLRKMQRRSAQFVPQTLKKRLIVLSVPCSDYSRSGRGIHVHFVNILPQFLDSAEKTGYSCR